MKQQFSKWFIAIVLWFGMTGGLNAKITPPQLSADLTMYQKNKVFDEGKLHVGKSASRMDFTKKMKQTHIYRFDADKIEAWMHNGNMIMEMKMQYNALVDYKPEGFSETCSGEETIDGHPCQKCVMTGKFMGQNVKTTIWKAKDLNGMVIKSSDEKGSGMSIKNIARGPQSDTLFQAPAGYHRMTMPGGMGDILKGMTN